MLIIPTITQDALVGMGVVDIHGLLAGPVDCVRVQYHCGNTEDAFTFKQLLAIRDRLSELRSHLVKKKAR
jgi:hypothetical protein